MNSLQIVKNLEGENLLEFKEGVKNYLNDLASFSLLEERKNVVKKVYNEAYKLSEDVVDQLRDIVSSGTPNGVVFLSGESLLMDVVSASKVMRLYDRTIDPAMRGELIQQVSMNSASFIRVLNSIMESEKTETDEEEVELDADKKELKEKK